MPRSAAAPPPSPRWDDLYNLAATQDGYFTTDQGAALGYSDQLLRHHVLAGRLQRPRRGIYRLTHYPAGETEDLTILWLWSRREGVFSHETALALHGLSDALPARIHITLPLHWRPRRLRVPEGLVIYHADLADADRTWHGAVPVVTPARAVVESAEVHVPPDLVRQAIEQGVARGLFSREDVKAATGYLRAFSRSRSRRSA